MKITTNPDKKFVKEIRKRIKENNGYCCCTLIKNEAHKCMCKDFRDQTVNGFCTCGLYYKDMEMRNGEQ